jgi:uncharacterized membrane protein
MRSSKRLVIALGVSLALNLALIGFVAGRASITGMRHLAPDPSLGAFRLVRQLPEARREALRPLIREHFRDIRPRLQQLTAAQTKIRDALDSEPYEPAELEQALGEFRAALLASQEHSHRALIRLASEMSPDERQRLMETMTWNPRPHHPHSGHQRPPGSPPKDPHGP